MNRLFDNYQAYSWHQSHDQATVLLLVPYETVDDDITVVIERNFVVAGVRGHTPLLKGRLYGSVDVPNSLWQLEPHASRISARERTTSSISTTSTQSSYAVVSDPEISSSFAASLEGALQSDTDEPGFSSPALSSPVSSTIEDPSSLGIHIPHHNNGNNGSQRRQNRYTASHPVSPHSANPPLSLASSFSSLESLHAGSGRLLTLHLEKAESIIWPSLVVGPVSETLSPSNTAVYPWTAELSTALESRYNMDPTSMVLIALDLCDIRNAKEEAFEYFVRSWHQAHVPSSTIRIATHYLPLNSIIPELSPTTSTSTSTPDHSPCATPTLPSAIHEFTETIPPSQIPGMPSYYLHRIGGPSLLAQLYLEAGLLHLEGTATNLLSSSYSGLSSLRTSVHVPPPIIDTSSFGGSGGSGAGGIGSSGSGGSGAEAWRRDRDTARRFFERARRLDGDLDVPLLPPTPDTGEVSSEPESVNERRRTKGTANGSDEERLQMPSIEIGDAPGRGGEEEEKPLRRRRKREDTLGGGVGKASTGSLVGERVRDVDDDDNAWYLYLPGLVGAGTALLVVGFLSFSSWRKGQGS